MPFVRLKIAASLDGITALPNGSSQWITSPEARADGHGFRAEADAILTGIGTVLADDPRLDVRTDPAPARQPAVVVADSRLRTPPDASLFIAARPRYIWAGGQFDAQSVALAHAGASVQVAPGAQGQLDLHALMRGLDALGLDRVHVEAGAVLNGALLRAGLVDEVLLYLAPVLLGTGRGMAAFGPLEALGQGCALDIVSSDRIGPDLRIVARVRRPGAAR